MTKKIKYAITAGLLCLCSLHAKAQTTMTVNMKEGDNRIFVIDDIVSTISFDNKDNILISQSNTDATASIATSEIRSITFGDGNGLEEAITQVGKIFIYPNPASEKIEFANVKRGATISIRTLDGILLYSFAYDGEIKDIRSLNKGLYIVTIDGQTFKFEKK